MRPPAPALVVATAILALAGCSQSGDELEPVLPPVRTTPAAPPVLQPVLPTVPAFQVEPHGVISDVVVTRCDTVAGPVTAAGSATNSGRFVRDVVVVVDWAVTGSGVVAARGVATLVDLQPGATVGWKVTAELAGDQDVSCVPTALAGQLSQ